MSPVPDRLSAIETGYLEAERSGLPLHIGAVATFEAGPLLDADGELRLGEIRAQVASRLDRVPHLRRRPLRAPLGLARPEWVDALDFDVADHVDAVTLPAGSGDEALRRHTEELLAQPLPPDRPLWHLRFVVGLDGDRVGLVERAHHALVDGVSGVDLATVLLDLTPEVEVPAAATWVPSPPPGPVVRLARGLADQVVAGPRAARAALRAVAHPTHSARQLRELAGALVTATGDGLVAPRWDLNRPVDEGRRLAWCRVDLEDVRAVGHGHGATVNDVVLSAVAHGLRVELLEEGRAVPPAATLKVLVPVSVRGEDGRGALGNQVGGLLLALPVGIGDPVARLHAVAAATRRLKDRREAAAAQLLLAALDLAPAPLVGPIARLNDRQRVMNTVVTNVPGPPVPLYCRGARMLDVVPFVPLGGNVSVEVAILSYDGTVTVALTSDARHGRDAERLRHGFEEGFAALGVEVSPTGRPRAERASAPGPRRRSPSPART